MKKKHPTIPNFTMIPNSQILMVDSTLINQVIYAKDTDSDDHYGA